MLLGDLHEASRRGSGVRKGGLHNLYEERWQASATATPIAAEIARPTELQPQFCAASSLKSGEGQQAGESIGGSLVRGSWRGSNGTRAFGAIASSCSKRPAVGLAIDVSTRGARASGKKRAVGKARRGWCWRAMVM